MNQFRLSNQYYYIGIFDSMDSNFTKTKGPLVFNVSNYIQIYNKFEKLSKITLTNRLFLECLVGQKFFMDNNQNLRRKSSSVFFAIVRNQRTFWFLETLLHSLFLANRPILNLQKIKIAHLDFFWPNIILDKLFMQTLMQNNFSIYNW
uniref:hypothetical protein n=1 Tax=Gracilaria usneoides TaxID=172951 RepID=UPI001D11FD24|nr:hypothetical protein LK225_mgp01 [Crassiphycus usneoides]UAD89889.1 hypothetical protein [Crassiphycus usneoides]